MGRPFQGPYVGAPHFTDQGWPGEADFVQSIFSAHQKSTAGSEAGEGTRQGIEQFGSGDAKQLIDGARRIRQRSQAVEQRPDPQPTTDRSHMPQGRMKMRGKTK